MRKLNVIKSFLIYFSLIIILKFITLTLTLKSPLPPLRQIKYNVNTENFSYSNTIRYWIILYNVSCLFMAAVYKYSRDNFRFKVAEILILCESLKWLNIYSIVMF